MSALGVALRIARRDAWRHRGRSLLIMTMIALPVLAVVAIDVLVRSGEVTPEQRVQMELADADAWIVAPEGVTELSQSWNFGYQPGVSAYVPDPEGDPRDIAAASLPTRPAGEVLPLLPAGSQLTPWRHFTSVPVLSAGTGYLSVPVDLLDIAAPAAGDRYDVVSGEAPSRPDQVGVTEHLAERLGVRVGDTVWAGAPQRAYTVSAITRTNALGSLSGPDVYDALVALPDALDAVAAPWDAAVGSAGYRYLVTSPEPITLPMIDELNAHGVAAYSRAVALDPAARTQVAPQQSSPLVILAVVIGIAMAVVQVVFLAGPAFAIGARRMRRQLGQLVAVGARPRDLRWVVLGTGLVIGVAGALTGLIAGIGLGLLLRPVLRSWIGYKSLGIHIVPVEVLGVAALGVITALLAALLPAATVARTSPQALLGRQPSSPRPVRWWSLVGALLAAAGVAVTVWAATRHLAPMGVPGGSVARRALLLVSGTVMVEIGLLLAVPLIVHLAARAGRRLPITGRLALRDADRHRSRTSPAIAAVTVCATAAVLLAVLISSAGKFVESRYEAGLPVGDVQVQFDLPGWDAAQVDPATAASAEQAIVAQWPQAVTVPYSVAANLTSTMNGRALLIPDENLCPYLEPEGPSTETPVGFSATSWAVDGAISSPDVELVKPTAAEMADAATDWRCFDRSFSALTAEQAHVHRHDYTGGVTYETRMPTVVIGGPALRHLLTGIDDPAADAALAGGGAVVMDRAYLASDGTVSSGVLGAGVDAVVTHGSPTPAIGAVKSVPAVLGQWSPVPLGVILSPQAARDLGWTVAAGGIVVDPGRVVTTDDARDLEVAIQATAGAWAQAAVEPGAYPDAADGTRQPLTAMLIIVALLAVGAVIVVTALGLADSRPDLATLAAVGASPRIRRLTTGWTAAILTFLGCLAGGVVGLVPAWGLLRLIQTIQGSHADPIIVPWPALAAGLVAVPVLAFAAGALLPRSRLPMIARVE